MRARLVLEGTVDGRNPLMAEVVCVETADGETLDVAGLAVASPRVALDHLEREPNGHPLFVYTTSDPIGGSDECSDD